MTVSINLKHKYCFLNVRISAFLPFMTVNEDSRTNEGVWANCDEHFPPFFDKSINRKVNVNNGCFAVLVKKGAAVK